MSLFLVLKHEVYVPFLQITPIYRNITNKYFPTIIVLGPRIAKKAVDKVKKLKLTPPE